MIVIEMLKEGVVTSRQPKAFQRSGALLGVRGKLSASYTLEHPQGTVIFFDRNDVEPKARW
jgi:hypothetical protein